MAGVDDISLIDLNCSIKEDGISVPLLPLPRINSPYEGDVSNDHNNPFDSAVQAVSYADDPFEFVSKKAQEFTESQKSDQASSISNCNDGDGEGKTESCGKSTNISAGQGEMKGNDSCSSVEKCAIVNRENINVMEYLSESTNNERQCNYKSVESVDLLSHIKSQYSIENRPEIISDMAPHQNKPDVFEASNVVTTTSQECSPEVMDPKYFSTPIHRLASSKRKVEYEHSFASNKRASNDFRNTSPASFVQARIEKCIAEAEKSFRNQGNGGEKQSCRKSLDSLMSRYSNPSYGRNPNFRCDQRLHGNYLNFSGNTHPKFEFSNSLKNLYAPTNRMGFSQRNFEESQEENSEPTEEEQCQLLEARFMSTVFKATADYHGKSLANESVINFVESEDETNEREVQYTKRRKTPAFKTASLEVEDEKRDIGIKHPKGLCKFSGNVKNSQFNDPVSMHATAGESSKSVMGKVLGKMQIFSPGKTTSLLKHRNSVATTDSGKNNVLSTQLARGGVNRSRSDSTILALKKREEIAKSSKSPRELSRLSNTFQSFAGGRSPLAKLTPVKNMGKVTKPLPKIMRNKKSLLTNKDYVQ